MGSGSSFIIGGLLQGLGKGITDVNEQHRQDALAKLKQAQDDADNARDFQQKKELLGVAQTGKLAEINATATASAAEKATERQFQVKRDLLLAALDTQKDAKSELLKAQIAAGTKKIHSVETLADGTEQFVFDDGSHWANDGVKLQSKTAGDGTGAGTIAAARAAAGGTAPVAQKPAATPTTALTPQEDATLRTQYANANPKSRPYMFDAQGNRLPYDQVKQMVLQRLSRGG